MSTKDAAPPVLLDVATLPPSQLARRRRIIDVATQMLEQEDYEQIQIRVVAERANVALGTLYRYFVSKEQLYAAVLLEWSASYAAVTHPPGTGARDRLRRHLHQALKAFQRRPQFYKVQAMLQTTTDPHAEALFEEFSARNHEALLRDLRPMSGTDAEVRVTILLATLGSVLTRFSYRHMTMEEARTVVDTCIDLMVDDESTTQASTEEPVTD